MALRYYVSSEEAPFFVNNKMGSSDRIPTSGTYKVGDFIISNTQADGIFGWVCTVAGTPGTWIEIGTGGSNTKTLSLSSSTVVSSPVSEVTIGIKDFNKNTDFLMVYKNSTYLTERVDYDISSDSTKIVSRTGNWNVDSLGDYRFSFVVIKEVEKVNPEAVVGTENIKDSVVTMSKLGEDVKERLDGFDSQLEHNMNEINKQFNTIETEKADKSQTSNLQGQINSLVVNGTGNSNPEVIQARVNATGVEFGTLTERNLYIENTLNGSNFPITWSNWEEGGINTNTGVDVVVSGYLRTKGYLNFNGLLKVSCSVTNATIYVLEYSKLDKSFIKSTIKTQNFELTNFNNYYRFVITPTQSTGLVATNYFNMLASYKFKEIEDLKSSVLCVDDMFNLVNDYIGDMSLKNTLKWELGGINGSNGSNVTIDYAIRCDYFNLPCGVVAISSKDMYCIVYNLDGTYHSRINKTDNTISLTDTSKKYRIVINMGSGNTITNISSILEYVSIKTKNQFEIKVKEVVNNTTLTNVLNGKNINCLGDSITSTDYTTPNWWQQIATKTGATFNNYGISGTCIGYNEQRETTNGKCFCNRYMDMDSTADGVIVMGGTNDYEIKLGTWNDSTNETFYGALNVLIKGLLEKFKGKPIIFMTPIQSANDYLTNIINPIDSIKNGSNSPVSLQLRAEAIRLKCKQYGITCIDLYSTSGINGGDSSKIYYRSGDSLHPSEYGQKVIANNLLPILESKFKF